MAAPRSLRLWAELRRAGLWLGGAALAGTAAGAMVALLFGG